MTERPKTVVSMQIEVEIQSATQSPNIPTPDQFQQWIENALKGKGERFSLAIRLVDEPEMQKINFQYRKKDYATNVLSFPSDLPESLPEEVRQSQLGDLLICAPLVRREAIEQGRREADHWAHLTIHGVLHLLGYDHEQDEDARVMESLEIETLARLGISDPYLDIS